MAERTVSCVRAVAGDRPQPATGECATRELAQRLSGTLEVVLLWHPEGDWVELSLRDVALGAGWRAEVRRSDALDAFYHPYAYGAGFDARGDDERESIDDA